MFRPVPAILPPMRRELHCGSKARAEWTSLDPYSYTAGRWLRNDEMERDARRIKFDFHALQRKVSAIRGGSPIASCKKEEGGSNRVFIFSFSDSSKRVVARLPTSVAGPSELTTNSEVSTIEYVRQNTSIPVPKILDWSDNQTNPVGSQYIIMEEAAGIHLPLQWPKMTHIQKIRCVVAISKMIEQTASLEFPAYGSLYFDDIAIPAEQKHMLQGGFCIGPHCGTRYWGRMSHIYSRASDFNRGPWHDLTAFCHGLIHAGICRLPVDDSGMQDRPRYHGYRASHLQLLDKGREILLKLAENEILRNTSAPTLVHPDLNKKNIFVSEQDPTIVTAIIDWQSASIEPAFMYADEVPDFADVINRTTMEPFEPNSDEVLCAKAFDACMKGRVPKLAKARAIDEDLLRPFRYCYRTWDDGAILFRQELIELSRRWTALGLAGKCPFEPLDLAAHQKDYKLFETAYDMKHQVMDVLNVPSDGWVPMDIWDQTLEYHRMVYEEALKGLSQQQGDDDDDPLPPEDLRRYWPFDVK